MRAPARRVGRVRDWHHDSLPRGHGGEAAGGDAQPETLPGGPEPSLARRGCQGAGGVREVRRDWYARKALRRRRLGQRRCPSARALDRSSAWHRRRKLVSHCVACPAEPVRTDCSLRGAAGNFQRAVPGHNLPGDAAQPPRAPLDRP
eukprot:scaffold3183_cov381-Prasinococcus_capsulatus_cf.AAC.2